MEETKEQYEARTGVRYFSNETRQKLSEAMKARWARRRKEAELAKDDVALAQQARDIFEWLLENTSTKWLVLTLNRLARDFINDVATRRHQALDRIVNQ
jgi:hypothetical protein